MNKLTLCQISNYELSQQPKKSVANFGSRAIEGPLDCWDGGFESCKEHAGSSFVFLVCCTCCGLCNQLITRSECVCLIVCHIETWKRDGLCPISAVVAQELYLQTRPSRQAGSLVRLEQFMEPADSMPNYKTPPLIRVMSQMNPNPMIPSFRYVHPVNNKCS